MGLEEDVARGFQIYGTVLLWLLDFLHGMNSYVVAIIPVAVRADNSGRYMSSTLAAGWA